MLRWLRRLRSSYHGILKNKFICDASQAVLIVWIDCWYLWMIHVASGILEVSTEWCIVNDFYNLQQGFLSKLPFVMNVKVRDTVVTLNQTWRIQTGQDEKQEMAVSVVRKRSKEPACVGFCDAAEIRWGTRKMRSWGNNQWTRWTESKWNKIDLEIQARNQMLRTPWDGQKRRKSETQKKYDQDWWYVDRGKHHNLRKSCLMDQSCTPIVLIYLEKLAYHGG